MKLYKFDQEVGKQVSDFNSKNFYISPISRIMNEHINVMQIACMYLGKEGIIGGHLTQLTQMLIVVEGEGWVKGENRVALPIRKGQIALWESGEWHETSTNNGLMAINIESDQLKAFKNMPLVKVQ